MTSLVILAWTIHFKAMEVRCQGTDALTALHIKSNVRISRLQRCVLPLNLTHRAPFNALHPRNEVRRRGAFKQWISSIGPEILTVADSVMSRAWRIVWRRWRSFCKRSVCWEDALYDRQLIALRSALMPTSPRSSEVVPWTGKPGRKEA